MTAHAAKGLEFKVVLITGLEDGLFPAAPRHHGERRGVQLRLCEERRWPTLR